MITQLIWTIWTPMSSVPKKADKLNLSLSLFLLLNGACIKELFLVLGTPCVHPLQWRHHECYGISNHQPHDCLISRLFRHRSKKTSKLRITGFCEGNPSVTGEFPAQRASNTENISIWWRHHNVCVCGPYCQHSALVILSNKAFGT